MHNPGSLIRRAHQIATSIFYEECAVFETTPLQHAVLWRAVHHPGLDQTTLARSIALDRTTTAKVVFALEKRDLILRRTDEQDRRTKRLFATRAGQELALSMNRAVECARERIVAPLAPSERKMFLALLKKVVERNNELSRVPFAWDALSRLKD
jgi:DNA-binding MarR family transcriptional regulator